MRTETLIAPYEQTYGGPYAPHALGVGQVSYSIYLGKSVIRLSTKIMQYLRIRSHMYQTFPSFADFC